ncbi:hypothetical protein EV359DRAFT_59842 [Lentinula novae-zelandiae]|nr:hypothetical protein EV359DRAFT_59842 [Lentinula novae-zelandiae]
MPPASRLVDVVAAGAVDTPFPAVLVKVVTGLVALVLVLELLSERTALLVTEATEDERTVVTLPLAIEADERVDGTMTGTEEVNEIGGDGVAESVNVAVTVTDEPPGRVVVRVITPVSDTVVADVVRAEEEADVVSENVPL